jgi:predicted TPR repeat methyltransferase
MISDNKTLDKVYTAKNHKDLMEAYGEWAKNYESDTVGEFGYVAPLATAQALDKFLDDPEVRILDAGCGTGLVGVALQALGYQRMDGLDYSREMLDQAEKKDVYQELMQADLSKPLDIGDNAYGAVTCCGTFTYGHVDAKGFDELIRITRPGGFICFTIREGAYDDLNYRRRMIELEQSKAWELKTFEDTDYLREENVTCKLCTYQVLGGNA